MAIAQSISGTQGTTGLFGAASVGVGLRVGLQAIRGSEEALAQIAEAREAAAEVARENLARARDDAARAERLERAARTDRVEAPEQDDRRVEQSSAPVISASAVNDTSSIDPQDTVRGGLLDVTV